MVTRNIDRRQHGQTYLGALLAVAILGATLAATGTVWSTARRQENEKELLFIGNEFRKAIENYYQRSPGGAQQYPPNLDALLKDPRFPTTVRYLRKIYRDPITGKADWGLVQAPEGGIAGVHSLSAQRPLKRAQFSAHDQDFVGRSKYSDWKFLYAPNTNEGGDGAAPPAVSGAGTGVTLVPAPASEAPPAGDEAAPPTPPPMGQ